MLANPTKRCLEERVCSLSTDLHEGAGYTTDELKALFDLLPTPVSWADISSDRILFINKAFAKCFGYELNQIPTVFDFNQLASSSSEECRLQNAYWLDVKSRAAGDTGFADAHKGSIVCRDGSIKAVVIRNALIDHMNLYLVTFENVTELEKANEKLRLMSLRDPLTGVGNRRALHEHWRQFTDKQSCAQDVSALLLIDLDGFKSINDQFGHDAGDAILFGIAETLQGCIRLHDLVCRIGGDEFAVLLTGLTDSTQLFTLCDRIAHALNVDLSVDRHVPCLRPGASIGVSVVRNSDKNIEDVMKRADAALYQVKAGGKGFWACHD
jgi:diguanylate cyclase (GGDEF)-like protein